MRCCFAPVRDCTSRPSIAYLNLCSDRHRLRIILLPPSSGLRLLDRRFSLSFLLFNLLHLLLQRFLAPRLVESDAAVVTRASHGSCLRCGHVHDGSGCRKPSMECCWEYSSFGVLEWTRSTSAARSKPTRRSKVSALVDRMLEGTSLAGACSSVSASNSSRSGRSERRFCLFYNCI